MTGQAHDNPRYVKAEDALREVRARLYERVLIAPEGVKAGDRVIPLEWALAAVNRVLDETTDADAVLREALTTMRLIAEQALGEPNA